MERLFLPFKIFWLSVTDVFAYPWLAQRSTKLKITTLLVIYALLAGASALHFRAVVWPQFELQVQENWENFQASWPEGLRLEYVDGKLNASSNESYTVPYPTLLPRQSGWPEHLARVDVDQAEPPTDSLLFVNSDTITTRTNGAPRSMTLRELLGGTPWSVDKAIINDSDDDFNQLLRDIRQGATIFWFVSGWLGLLLLRLIGLLLYAWIIQALYSFMGIQLRYWQSYSLGMVLLLPAETVQTITTILYPNSLPFFWWAWLGFALLIGWLNRRRF